jgi:hypothetical protein
MIGEVRQLSRGFRCTCNPSDACNYHEGDLDIDRDSDAWDDWDENCHGTINYRLEKDHSEGFMWSCY